MASYTSNLNLKKPAGSENVSIGDINNNMDLIDNAYGQTTNKMNGFVQSKVSTIVETSFTLVMDSSDRHFVVITSNSMAKNAALIIQSSSAGNVSVGEAYKGNNITYDTSVQNKITFTVTGEATRFHIADFVLSGSLMTLETI